MLAQRAASEGGEGSRQTIFLARRTRTMKRCSPDARSEGQSGDSPEGKVGNTGRPRLGYWHVSACQWVGENDARSGRSISPHPLRGDARAWREHYRNVVVRCVM